MLIPCGVGDQESLARFGIVEGSVDCVVSMQVLVSTFFFLSPFFLFSRFLLGETRRTLQLTMMTNIHVVFDPEPGGAGWPYI